MTAASLLSKPPTHCRDESGECVARRLHAYLRGNARVPRGNACRIKNTGEKEKREKERKLEEGGKYRRTGRRTKDGDKGVKNKVCERTRKDTKVNEKERKGKGKEWHMRFIEKRTRREVDAEDRGRRNGRTPREKRSAQSRRKLE